VARKKKSIEPVVAPQPVLSDKEKRELWKTKEKERYELQKILAAGFAKIEKTLQETKDKAQAFADEHGLSFTIHNFAREEAGAEYVSEEALRLGLSDNGGELYPATAGWGWMSSWC
jgi:hypothetical protein